MTLKDQPNINYLWSALIVEELLRLGVKNFCICPGSRSSALTMSVAKNKKAETHIHFDERSNGFYALGLAAAKKEPVVIITTSGTAVANLFPAIIEASKKKLPLIILSADRPVELRQTGAHQTIDQVKIFGEYIRFYFDMPTPTIEINPSFVLTTVDQAVFSATTNLTGPVHINCMFREPLAPIKKGAKLKGYVQKLRDWEKSKKPFTNHVNSKKLLDFHQLEETLQTIKKSKSGLIVVGKLSSPSEEKAVLKLAETLKWPVFPDITSGLRLGNNSKFIIHYFDQVLHKNTIPNRHKPDTILHLGGRITSKRYYQYIENSNPKNYIMVLNHPLRNDPLHNVTTRIHCSVKEFIQKLKIKKAVSSKLLKPFQKYNSDANLILKNNFLNSHTLSESLTARIITETIPSNHTLFLASSMPIRYVDMFANHMSNKIPIGSNRGASGIDGTIASAAGFATGLKKKTTLIIGDLAFLYDLNSLAFLKSQKNPLTTIVLNNNGGAIFSQLPISKNNKLFDKYFSTPHGLNFNSASELFNVEYKSPNSINEFRDDYQTALKSSKSTVIEVKTTIEETTKNLNSIKNQILKQKVTN